MIICEKTGRWAVAFRRALGEERELIVQVRGLTDCTRQLALSPGSIVAAEVTAGNLDALLVAVPDWLRRFPHCRVIAMLESDVLATETMLREAGVVAVLNATREAPSVIRLIQRHLESAPTDDLPLEQAIQRSLPWAKWATHPA